MTHHFVALQQVEATVTSNDFLLIAAAIGVALIAVRLIAPIANRVLTWLARRSIAGQTARWRARAPRVFGETPEMAELRRRQRISSTATALSRVVSALIWIAILVFVLHRFEINTVLAISGAGFLGLAVAIGGQHSVSDFVTGLHILTEDRFGEGDQLRLMILDEVVTAEVAHLGAFSTRLKDDEATVHIPNRDMTTIINLSQRGAGLELEFEPSLQIPIAGDKRAVEAAVRNRYAHTKGFDGSRDGLVVDWVRHDDDAYTIKIRTARPLSQIQKGVLTQGIMPEGFQD